MATHTATRNNSGSAIVQTLEHRVGSSLHYRTPTPAIKNANITRDAARYVELVNHDRLL